MTKDIRLITENLYEQLKTDIRESKTIFILSAFLMDSGVKLIKDDLQAALNRGADVKILTGDYMYVTQPKALRTLLQLEGQSLEVRLWNSDGVSFHPKSFLFNREDRGAVVIGSSNLSKSALTTGVEWNIRLTRSVDQEVFEQAIDDFLHLFYAINTVVMNEETMVHYEESYQRFSAANPHFVQKMTEREEIEMTLPAAQKEAEVIKEEVEDYIISPLTPRPSQIEALQALENTYAEGYDKSLVV